MNLLGVFLPVAAAVAWFVVSLVLYRKTGNTDPKKRVYYIMLIVSAVVAGVILLLLLGFIWIVYMAAAIFEELF